MRWLVSRVGLALLAGLLAAELMLQLAGLVVRATSSRASGVAADAQAITVLCVGDSHTYGLPLPVEQSYPAQLERALALRHPGRRFQVVNLGIPGLNSAYAANRLERQMLQLDPALVIVWVGINNQWNVAETEVWQAEGPDRWQSLRRVLMRSKLFRLASIAWFTQSGHQYDPEQRGGWFEGEIAPSARAAGAAPSDIRTPPGLAFDLARMLDTTRSLGVPIFFVSYPLPKQEPVNRAIRLAGEQLGVPVVESARARERAQADGHTIDELIDLSAGPHPSGLLYRYVVERMLPLVDGLLEAWHGLELSAPDGEGDREAG